MDQRSDQQLEPNSPIPAPDPAGGPNGGVAGAIRERAISLHPLSAVVWSEFARQKAAQAMSVQEIAALPVWGQLLARGEVG